MRYISKIKPREKKRTKSVEKDSSNANFDHKERILTTYDVIYLLICIIKKKKFYFLEQRKNEVLELEGTKYELITRPCMPYQGPNHRILAFY